ncbi:MAG: hypothetical protein MJY58_03690 [Bacteroidaceae bacterium]|nr:hypothetical protein [Bacteroidaceae bacterium]
MMRQKKNLLFAVALTGLVWCSGVSAQKKGDFTLSGYGFVDVRSYMDTRKSVAGADDYLYLYPLNEAMINGTDVNDTKAASMLGSTVRFGFNMTGPKVLGADSRANVEFDVFNYNSNAFFLFRHCYTAFDWENSSVTLGHTWHPMGKLMPGVGSIAVGSPFNSLNRSGQLRYDYKAGDVTFEAAGIFQSLNNSTGPLGRSYAYQRRSMIPELYVGLEWNGEYLSLAAGAEWQKISPADSIAGTDVKNRNQYVESVAGMAQAVYKNGKFQAMAKTYYGQNMSQLGICTGYGLKAGTDDEWSPLTASSSWVFVDYGSDFKVGCFAGYMKNLGADDNLDASKICAAGSDGHGTGIDRMYRIAPNIKYKAGNTQFCIEDDITGVSYGEVEAKGTVKGGDFVVNNRILLAVTYLFSL